MDCFGWIKLHRGLKDKGFYYNIKYLAVWIDILLSVNHKDKKIVFNNEEIIIKSGSFIMSQKAVSKKFGISLGTVNRILKHFENENQIGKQSTNKFTIISITNWEKWQLMETDLESTLKPTETWLKPTETNKNEKNVKIKEVKKKETYPLPPKEKSKQFVPPTIDDVKKYFVENGFMESAGEKAFKYYSTGEWKDSQGKPVKNWKQKIFMNWFKEENKVDLAISKPKIKTIAERKQEEIETFGHLVTDWDEIERLSRKKQ